MKEITAVAISGGVDSLVAAHRLKETGHNIFGIHFRSGYETRKMIDPANAVGGRCGIKQIAAKLGIVIHILDIQEDFKKAVIDYFTRTYRAGRTPNPCIVCNQEIKFGRVLEEARDLGATRLATGHYANIQRDPDGGAHLLRGVDPIKEQSYFLAFLRRNQLTQACFPLGDWTKEQTIRYAQAADLKAVTKTESQDICFISDASYGAFLRSQPGFREEPGPIVNRQGQQIGRHNGLYRFTVGQRKGIDCPAKAPYYVLQIDVENNRLVVGFKEETYSVGCRVHAVNWIEPRPLEAVPMHTRVRYRHRAAAGRVIPVGETQAEVCFDKPQSAVTPGQAAVFYLEDRVVGGGWIESSIAKDES